jgi:hypothetical protein
LAIPKYWADDETVVEPMSDYVDPLEFAPGVLNLFSLTVFFAALTSLISALDRYRWRTVGVACSIYVVQATMMFVAMAAPEWGWLKRLTIFGAYEPQVHVATAMRNPDSLWSIVRIGEDGAWAGCGATGAAILLLVLAGTCWTAAAIVYRRRDLPAP